MCFFRNTHHPTKGLIKGMLQNRINNMLKGKAEVSQLLQNEDEDGNPYLVGLSHWKGTVDKGQFSTNHGQMTSKLAHMFIKLCERYATRSNWRGYTYNEEMRGQALLQLSQIGLQFDESKSDNPFAYYTAAITNSFTRVLNIEKKNQSIRDDILEMNGLNPSWTRQNAELDAKLEEKYNKQAKEQSK